MTLPKSVSKSKLSEHIRGSWQRCTLSVKKKPVKSDQFFIGDRYFPPTNSFTRLKLTPTKTFYQLFFLLNKNQITEILKKIIRFITVNRVNDEVSSNDDEAAIVIETDQSKPVSHTGADQSKLVSYTDSDSEEKYLHVDVNFDEPIDLAINFLFLK